MSIDKFIVYFVIMAFLGYVYETIAMTLWSSQFDDRGFLFGPIIPIYGVGSVLATMIFNYVLIDLAWWQIFLIGVFGSAVLEYPTHYVMEKLLHKRWWDYSNSPLNINGRVCLPAALGFGIGILIVVKVINPLVLPVVASMSDLSANVHALLLTVVFSFDFALTISSLSHWDEKMVTTKANTDQIIAKDLSHILKEEYRLSKYFYGAVNAINRIKIK